MTAARRPTRLDTPLPGQRCPGCWLEYREPVRLTHILMCTRCFTAAIVAGPDRVVPFEPSRVPQQVLDHVHTQRRELIAQASTRWRALHPGLR